MVANTSMYGFNPYMNTGLNDDFMVNATALNNPYIQASMPQLQQQPATDYFQKSEEGSGLNTGLKLAAAGGIGAGAGTYFFGDKVGANITTDGKTFSDNILKAYEKDPVEIAKTKSLSNFAAQKASIVTNNGFASVQEYEAIKKYISTPAADRINLPKEVTDLVPDSVKNRPDGTFIHAKLNRTNLAIDGIDIEKLTKQELKAAQQENLAYQMEELRNLSNRKSLVEGLAKDATPAQIEEFITKNPKAFGIEKTVEAEIQAEAKAIATKYGATSQAELLSKITGEVTNTENSIKSIRTRLNGEVASHWDDAAKAFRESAPNSLKDAAKNFKWSKAGKYGAIAAGAGLVLGWLFGKS